MSGASTSPTVSAALLPPTVPLAGRTCRANADPHDPVVAVELGDARRLLRRGAATRLDQDRAATGPTGATGGHQAGMRPSSEVRCQRSCWCATRRGAPFRSRAPDARAAEPSAWKRRMSSLSSPDDAARRPPRARRTCSPSAGCASPLSQTSATVARPSKRSRLACSGSPEPRSGSGTTSRRRRSRADDRDPSGRPRGAPPPTGIGPSHGIHSGAERFEVGRARRAPGRERSDRPACPSSGRAAPEPTIRARAMAVTYRLGQRAVPGGRAPTIVSSHAPAIVSSIGAGSNGRCVLTSARRLELQRLGRRGDDVAGRGDRRRARARRWPRASGDTRRRARTRRRTAGGWRTRSCGNCASGSPASHSRSAGSAPA